MRRIDHHLEEESIEGLGQACLEETTVETVKDDFDHAPRVGSAPRRPKKHFGSPGAEHPCEELHSTITIDKLETHWTLVSVNVERTKPERATLRTVGGRLCARRVDSFDSSVELLVDSGATSDFKSMQTAKSAQLLLYKLTQ